MVEMTDFFAGGLWAVPRAPRKLKKGGEVEARLSASGFPISRDTCFSLWAKLAGLWQRTNILRVADLGQEKKAVRGLINEPQLQPQGI